MGKVCYYHKDNDGIASGAIVKMAYPDCKFIGVQYGDEWKKEDTIDNEVIVVDFSFDNMDELRKNCKSLCWIDHHKTAKEKNKDLWDNPEIDGLRCLEKAGCELTWDWFFPKHKIPLAIKLIGDYDTWTFNFIETKPFNEYAYYMLETPELPEWKILFNSDSELRLKEMIREGKLLLKAKNIRVETAFKNGFDAFIDGYVARIMNTPNDISDTGNYPIKEHKLSYAIGAIWRMKGNKIIVSLRGNKHNNIDVAKIAEKYGGGGHKLSAAFSFEYKGDLFPYINNKKEEVL